MTPPDRRERLARAALSRISEPDTKPVTRLVAEVGVVEALERILEDGAGLSGELLAGLRARFSQGRAAADLATVERVGGRFVCPGDAEWPDRLDVLEEPGFPCLGLWVRGALDLAEAVGRAISVVGSRASTDYGEYAASELAAGLVERGWAVVSGGAYGIDAAAHRGALAGGGVTVAVLACGVDVAYPRGNASLFQRIAAEGLIVSEHPPGCAPQRLRFLVRNRVIAALGAGTVVVEAAHRSGAMSTAHHAETLGRELMAVPGPVTSVMSSGCHRLVRDGATLVTSPDEVIEQVSAMGEGLALDQPGETRVRDALDPRAQRVLDAVPVRRPAPVESLAACCGLSVPTVSGALVVLQRRGLVEEVDDCWRLRPGAESR